MLEQTWRWFGPNDRISLEEIQQTGVKGIVTALHQIPTGETWSRDKVKERKLMIEKSWLNWSVVESIPVHEDIKKRTGKFKEYIENYKKTITNLGKEGIRTVCYNFMPVTDWSRTNLELKFEDGAESLSFNYISFVIIDIFLLKRKNASDSYSQDIVLRAEKHYKQLSENNLEKLKNTFLLGFPGSGETFSLKEVNKRIEDYAEIDKNQFRENLKLFLEEIIPCAEEAGIRMAIHPDDPPWPLMGLPRIVGNDEDLNYILQSYDSPSNGLTFCTGSLGAAHFNDLAQMSKKYAHRINFGHLRNVNRDKELNFRENYVFDGDIDMYIIMKNLILEQEKRKNEGKSDFLIPYRPDHGQQILGDLNQKNYPGYSLYGRMKNLAELRGLEIGIRRSLLDSLIERIE
jgi:mannonate dehydratase